MNTIVNAIKANEKRMAKLSTLNGNSAREQAMKYVVAECQAQKVRLPESEMIKASIMIVGI